MDSLEGLMVYWISIRLWRKVWIWGNRRDRYPRPAESDGFGGGWDGTKKGQDAAEQGDKEVEGNLLSSPPLFSGTTPSSPDLAWVVDFPCSWHLTSFGASWPLWLPPQLLSISDIKKRTEEPFFSSMTQTKATLLSFSPLLLKIGRNKVEKGVSVWEP